MTGIWTVLALLGGTGALLALIIWLARRDAIQAKELGEARDAIDIAKKRAEIAAEPDIGGAAVRERMRQGEL